LSAVTTVPEQTWVEPVLGFTKKILPAVAAGARVPSPAQAKLR
jgi:hypothetical protein